MSDDGRALRERTLAALRDDQRQQDVLDELTALAAPERRLRIDAAVAAALILLLGDPGRTRQRRAADALSELARDVPPVVTALRTALSALEPRLRWGAAYTLGHADRPPPRDIWPAVRETLALEDGDQRWAAAELTCALARAHPDVRDDLLVSATAGSTTMRRMVLYCLRDLGDAELGRIVRAGLADPDAGVRLAALSAGLRCRLPPGETAALADEIASRIDDDPDPGVRRAAAATLGKLGVAGPRVLAALSGAIAGDDPSLARAAAAARARLTAGPDEN